MSSTALEKLRCPQDLSRDLGCENNFSAEPYQSTFAKIEQAAARAGLLLGTKPHAGFTIERLIGAGRRLIVPNGDTSALREGYRMHLSAVRQV